MSDFHKIPRYGAGLIWGVIGPRMQPCLFGNEADAKTNCDPDERVALFRVEEVDPPTPKKKKYRGTR